MPDELERKFIIRHLPEKLSMYHHHDIEQGYFLKNPGMPFLEERLRIKDGTFSFTSKIGEGSSRNELERTVSYRYFEVMWPLTEGRRIEKIRYDIPLENGLVAELDIFCGKLMGHVTAEVEFKTADEMDSFVPPSWFGEEVTKDPRYQNYNLSVDGLPK